MSINQPIICNSQCLTFSVVNYVFYVQLSTTGRRVALSCFAKIKSRLEKGYCDIIQKISVLYHIHVTFCLETYFWSVFLHACHYRVIIGGKICEMRADQI